MSTLTIFPFDFLIVIAGGGLICAAAWFLKRGLIQRSRGWRAVFCILVATTITPSCLPVMYGFVFAPAIVLAYVAYDVGVHPLLLIPLCSGLPILAVSALLFSRWRVFLSPSQKHENDVA